MDNLNLGVLASGIRSQGDIDKKRKAKEENRRKVKEQRKNRVKESKAVTEKKPMTKETFMAKQVEKQQIAEDKEQIDKETLLKLSFPEKLSLVKSVADEIIFNTERKYRRLNDLIVFTEDPKDVDIVLKAVQQLCRVFVEIIPAYRIREESSKGLVDDEAGAKKGMKLSKEVSQLRDYESFLLRAYKQYLEILEKLQKIKPGQLLRAVKISDEAKKEHLYKVYVRLRNSSVSSLCTLVKAHPHFNYRLIVVQLVFSKLASQDSVTRREATKTLFELLAHPDQTLLDFKIEILRELNKVIKTKQHDHMEPNLLDCLVLHMIVVDEEKAQAIAESTQKSSQLHDQMAKLRKKGKLKDYKEIKQELLAEVK